MSATEEHPEGSNARQIPADSRALRGLDIPSADAGNGWREAGTTNHFEHLFLEERRHLKMIPGIWDGLTKK